jgi:phosphoadenosine phosphosulfate reductase
MEPQEKPESKSPTKKKTVSTGLPSKKKLISLANEWEERTPEEILAWAIATYGNQLTLACSFGGPSGMVLLDMAMKIKPDIAVFYLDTGLLFPETYALAEKAANQYHFKPHAIRPALSVEEQAKLYGEALWSREPDACCAIRKVEPERVYLKHYAAWITGIRRDQSSTRSETPVFQWDSQFNLAKISPMVRWTERDVWNYIVTNNVPYNPLHDQNYPSIGCTYCTRPIKAGEDLRAGRWSGFNKIECGLHPASSNKDYESISPSSKKDEINNGRDST